MKKLATLVLAISLAATLVGCNKQVVDLSYNFKYAWIALPDGSCVQGPVQSWKDYEGDQIQVKIYGVTYLTDTTRCVLASEY